VSASRFKILFVLTPGLNPQAGGVQMSTTKLGTHFAKCGHEVGVFSFASDGHVPCDFGRLVTADQPGGCGAESNLKKLEATLAELQPEVVINQMPYEQGIGEVLKVNKRYLLLGCLRNTLFSVRGNLPAYVARTAPGPLKGLAGWAQVQQAFLALHRRRHRAELLKILDTYDHFVMFGPPNLEELEWFVPGFARDRVRLIPNSIPYIASDLPRKEKRLLWLGRVAHEQKRAELILPIWARVCDALQDWHLDVVGDGPLLAELERRVIEMGLPRITFYGRQESDAYYRRAALFFMTSAFEGFPNTLVEAQSHGAIPVIFDSYPVARWLVEDGVNGVLISPFDVDTMAARIVELAGSADRDVFAEQALDSARRFHIDRVGELWQQLFETEVPRHVGENPAALQYRIR